MLLEVQSAHDELEVTSEGQELPDFQDAAESAEYLETVEMASKLLAVEPKALAASTVDHLYGCMKFSVQGGMEIGIETGPTWRPESALKRDPPQWTS